MYGLVNLAIEEAILESYGQKSASATYHNTHDK